MPKTPSPCTHCQAHSHCRSSPTTLALATFPGESSVRTLHSLLVMAAAVVSCITAIDPTSAQTYPSHTVRIVVPFGAGSLTDILARMIAEDGSKKWGQQVIVENRPGLPGTI